MQDFREKRVGACVRYLSEVRSALVAYILLHSKHSSENLGSQPRLNLRQRVKLNLLRHNYF